jgi:hypothetical protein
LNDSIAHRAEPKIPPQSVGPLLPFPAGQVDPTALLFTKGWWLFFQRLAQDMGLTLRGSTFGTHAQRLATTEAGGLDIDPANYLQGALYTETDRGAIYQDRIALSANGKTQATWVYAAGQMVDLFANRPADLGANDAGFSFRASDTTISYRWSGTAWIYVAGVYTRTQAQLAALIATLAAGDVGLRIYVSDFHHVLWCTAATTTSWAPEDDLRAGEGPILREIDPSPVAGWQLYDGTAGVLYLKADGTTGTVTLPDLVSAANKAAYAKAGSPNGGPNAAVPPTVGAAAATDTAVTGITNPANTGSTTPGPTGLPSATQNFTTGITAAASSTHTHTEAAHTHTVANPTDPGHFHTLSTLVLNADGEPRNIVRRPWFRQ